jgi:hypothetical protein
MGYVSYVGRVGALAVALGVGTAVATMPGVALAEPSGSTSSSSSSPSGSAGSSASSSTSSTSPSSTDAATSSDGTQTSSKASAKTPARSVKSHSSKSPIPHANPTSSVSTQQSPNTLRLTNTTSSPDLGTLTSAGPAAGSSPVALAAATPTAAIVAPQVDRAPVSGPLAPLKIVTNVVSAVLGWAGLSPSMTNGPVAPAQTPVLWTLLAWVRREIGQTLSKGTAVAAVQHTGLVTVNPPGPVVGPNLLLNGGAEVGDPSLSAYSSVTLPGWTVTGTPTVIQYGTQRRFPLPLGSPGPTLPSFLAFPSVSGEPAGGGAQFFGGGPVATSTLTQIVNLSGAASEIDAGTVPYEVSGDLGGFTIDPSAASVTVDFLDATGVTVGTGKIKPVTALARSFHTELLARDTIGVIPVGTRSAKVVVTLADHNPVLGNYNNAYADDLSLTVGANLPAPPPPTPPASTVGQLDHVFMVYMENKGAGDIVGSPNAPYLNSLIDTYGYGADYHALTHPSDPNYYPILGGSDFGINYNCASNCFDQPNLADTIEAAGKTWAGYEQGMPFPGATTSTANFSPDELPFLAFTDIFDNPARAAAHLFPLTQMATDLNSAATTPNFAWFAANEANNMEGPLSFPFGLLQFALTQVTNHQYNVKAGDAFLQQEIPTIMNSPVWQDPTQKSAIFITFDEDNNNLSLGFGNEGNNVPMIVIPSPGAVAAGMRSGHFVAEDYNNHYSLLRTIDDSLGLPPLTNNDRYAEPMNDYWV